MTFYESLRTAVGSLTTNKLRASLTMLGIIIGVASVVTLLSVGEGVQTTITGQIESIGSNLVFVIPQQPEDSAAPAYVTYEDARAVADPFAVPAVEAVAPVAQTQLRVSRGDRGSNVTVSGTTHQYGSVRSVELSLGGFLTEADVDNEARVVVLGWGTYVDLFDDGEYPVGQIIKVNGVPFEVIGVMEEQGGFGNEDYTVYVPLTTARMRFFTQRTLSGELPLSAMYISAISEEQIDAATEQITVLLRDRHQLASGQDDDFRVTSQQAILDIASQITGVFTLFLGAIAGISLLVGGIGIMNIMLVSVTERTREVGIRKAVGATKRDILVQFLVEAIVLSFIGGLIGLGLGITGAKLISNLAPDLTTKVTPQIMLLATSVASAVGLVFGVYPALRAANLRPIDALRYE